MLELTMGAAVFGIDAHRRGIKVVNRKAHNLFLFHPNRLLRFDLVDVS